MFCGFAKVLQDRGLNLLQSQGIQVLLGNVASEVTKDEVRAFVHFFFFFLFHILGAVALSCSEELSVLVRANAAVASSVSLPGCAHVRAPYSVAHAMAS